jgi:carnitine-CoA ligase
MSEPINLLDQERNVKSAILAAAERFGDSVAITDGQRHVRYRDLPDHARKVAGYLRELGVGEGDRVVIVAENCMEILELLLACSWLGAILVPLNPASKSKQIQYFVTTTEPTVVFVDEATSVGWRSDKYLSSLSVTRLDLGIQSQISSAVDHFDPNPDTTLAILFTSGTTGNPKGVMCPHSQFIYWGEIVGGILEMGEDDVVYTCLPLFHTNALNAFIQSLLHGAVFHLGPRFSVSKFWSRMQESGTTITYLLGAMVAMLMTNGDTSLDKQHKVRNILAPGTPAPVLREFEERFGVRLFEAHGMTETNATIGPDRGQQQIGFMGKVIPGFEAKIVDVEGVSVPMGEAGELLLRSNLPGAFARGYWRMPEETERAWRDGWFHSGDRVIEVEGWYKFVDRIKDVIRRRGENISAWEVEQALQSLDQVSVAAAIAVPSELGEDEVMAFIVLDGENSIAPNEILDSCSSILPRHALPRFIEFVDELPLTETGKIRKVELRALGVRETTWDAQKEGYSASRR